MLFDTQAPALLYVFQPANPATADARGEIVLRVNYRRRHRGETTISNSIRTAGYVNANNLREDWYDLLDGALE